MTIKSGLRRVGQGLEGSLHFLCEIILILSFARLVIHWIFGI